VPQIAVEVQDPDFTKQWMHRQLKTPDAWAQGFFGEGIRIGIHDTLVDVGHPDLKENIDFPGYHAAAGELICPDTPWMGVETHGTMVAGTAAAAANKIGGRGVAPKARIVPIAIDDPESGALTLLGIVRGALFAVGGPEFLGLEPPEGCQPAPRPEGAPFVDIVNMSWGSISYDQVVKDTMDFMLRHGVILVTSAGNTPTTGMAEPAWYPGLITVAATEPSGRRTDFSNRGKHLTVAAPGENIWTTTTRACLEDDPSGRHCTPEDADYAFVGGTSFSSPATAGVAALVLEAAGGSGALDARQVRTILAQTAWDVQGDGYDEDLGWGIVDAAAAVEKAQNEAERPEPGVNAVVYVVESETGAPVPQVGVTLEPLDEDSLEPPLLFTQTTGSGLISDYGLAMFNQISPGRYRVWVGGPNGIDGIEPNVASLEVTLTPENPVVVVPLELTLPEDPYEPNDAPDQAFAAEVGRTYRGALYREEGGDADFFALELKAGKTYTFNTETLTGSADLGLVLYDAAGNLVAENSENQDFTYDALIVFTPESDGTYYLGVITENESNSPFDTYALDVAELAGEEHEPNGDATIRGTNLSDLDFSQAEPMALGTSKRAALDPPGDVDIFKLDLSAGTALVADTETASSGKPDTMLALYDAEGTLIAFNDDFTGRESRLVHTVGEDGTYYLVVAAWDGDNPDNVTTGNYLLTLTQLDRP